MSLRHQISSSWNVQVFLVGFVLVASAILASSCQSDNETNSADGDSETQSDGDTDDPAPDGDDPDGDAMSEPWRSAMLDAIEDGIASDCENGICLGDLVQLIPSENLPSEITPQNGNDNLDVAVFEGRVFVAFRSAPDHFASPDADIWVMSSDDLLTWRYEGRFSTDFDVREPRLLSWNGKLFLYFAVLGEFMIEFTPKGMMAAEYHGPDDWSEADWFYGEGFIPWRVKVIDDIPYMITYVGGENIYDPDGEEIEVHWLTTTDGFNWTPVVPDQPVVIVGGASETDFVFLDDGTLLAVSRNESGDEYTGFGMKICRAEADTLGDWTCVGDPKKYDSPLMFKHRNTAYLIGRRNVTETGNFDLGYSDRTLEDQWMAYSIDYWKQPKRCALWRVNPDLTVDFLRDLPSKGDTCFPGLLTAADGSYRVFNYTSPLDGEDVAWQTGQFGHTLIYHILMHLD